MPALQRGAVGAEERLLGALRQSLPQSGRIHLHIIRKRRKKVRAKSGHLSLGLLFFRVWSWIHVLRLLFVFLSFRVAQTQLLTLRQLEKAVAVSVFAGVLEERSGGKFRENCWKNVPESRSKYYDFGHRKKQTFR